MASIAATVVPAPQARRDGVEWRLASPLALAYVAFFASPLLLLLAISFYDDTDLTRIGGSQWVKFFTDPFYLSVIGHTLQARRGDGAGDHRAQLSAGARVLR